MRNRIKLTEQQFEIAIQGLRKTKDDPTEAARMILVEGKEPGEAAKLCNQEPGNVSNKVGRILENLSKQLKKHNMTYTSLCVENDLLPAIETIEKKSLEILKNKPKSRKKT